MTITADIQQLELPAEIELFELDMTELGEPDIYRFHDGRTAQRNNIVWQGETYAAYPITVTGFDMSTNGQLPRPKMRVANVNSGITALILAYNDLVGAKLTRKRTLSKYLDAVNFPGGVNPTADPNAAFADDIFFVDRKGMEDDTACEFELATASDVSGVQIPRRMVVQNVCPWRYRSTECSYAGPPIADNRDNMIASTVAVTPEEIAYFTARQDWLDARNNRIASQQNIATLQNNLTRTGELVKLQDLFDVVYPNQSYVLVYTNGIQARFNDAIVTLGTTYRQGTFEYGSGYSNTEYYRIERWGINTGAQAAAQAAYDIGYAAWQTAITDEATALGVYQAATAALPALGAVFSADQCGKRLSSCKLRFNQPDQSGVLPFGGFPAVGLVS